MGLQYVDGKHVYVVEFDRLPQLPITGVGFEKPFAMALTQAIETRQITEPGRYAIELTQDLKYNVYKIVDPPSGG